MIFKKKLATTGNFVFSNGTKAIFNEDGLYKTEKESEIKELTAESELFEVLSEKEAPKEVKPAAKNHEQLAKAITGLQTSKTA